MRSRSPLKTQLNAHAHSNSNTDSDSDSNTDFNFNSNSRSTPSLPASPHAHAHSQHSQTACTPASSKPLICAIYTRKSSEEGLEQDFNSLDAQREACSAYIASQQSLGWIGSPTLYDDGGYSGGTLERPALMQLLADMAERKIDVLVVYKVDRLTRSLLDFTKLVQLFDAHAVSFVSVTQQFNTTTSMGRLTLNVLLSFAQFEREVTAERIRDKIAASKRKGLWMGGNPPMGYIPNERTLKIDWDEAARVRKIFSLYLDCGCVSKLKRELDRMGWRTPVRARKSALRKSTTPVELAEQAEQIECADQDDQTHLADQADQAEQTQPAGLANTIHTTDAAHTVNDAADPNREPSKSMGHLGYRSFSRGHLYGILNNPIYIGKIRHKTQIHEGKHPPIIDLPLWNAVQQQLHNHTNGSQGRRRENVQIPKLLAGILFDGQGEALTPTYSKKGTRLYQYYVSNALHQGMRTDKDQFRVPALELEKTVIDACIAWLGDEARLLPRLLPRPLHLPQLDRQHHDPNANPNTNPNANLDSNSDICLDSNAAQVFAGALTQAQERAAQLSDPSTQYATLRQLVRRITIYPKQLEITLAQQESTGYAQVGALTATTTKTMTTAMDTTPTITVPIQIKRLGLAVRLIVGSDTVKSRVDPKLVALIHKALRWFELLECGKCDSLAAIGKQEGIGSSYVSRVINLAFLSPQILQVISQGRQPEHVTADRLVRMGMPPVNWDEQWAWLEMKPASHVAKP